ncbi:MAG: DUF6599 family protein [Candidatus Aminicenantaceae bacterium]
MKKIVVLSFSIIFFLFVLKVEGTSLEKGDISYLKALLPEVQSWKLSEEPQDYSPEILFEYIDGAAEIYLSYNFEKLIVAQYQKVDSAASLTIEIYDMGNEKNSFGIYSVERFPESNYLTLGNGGYMEEGALNFIVGTYYVKLLCFECEDYSEDSLKLFSQNIIKNVKDKKDLPPLLEFFPEEGLVEYSSKFILRNFLGQNFFHNGYIASYRLEDLEFDCFFIEGKNEKEAEKMLSKYFEYYAQNNKHVQKIPLGYHIKNSYYKNVYVAQVKNYICGVFKIKDGSESVGKRYLKFLIDQLR